MSSLYPQIKMIHVACVIFSIGLFSLRGCLMLMRSRLSNNPVLRFTSYTIDTALLVSAIALMMILHQYPIAQHWLTLKVGLLIAYIVLGVIALKRGRTQRIKVSAFAAALCVVWIMYGIAKAHHPLGWLRWWGWV